MMMQVKLEYLAASAGSAVAGLAAPTLAADRVIRALGLSMDWPELIAGLCFAVAGGFVAMAVSPPDDRLDKWATLATALLIGLLAAIAQPAVPLVETMPVQLVMGVAGLGSRKAVDRARNHDFTLPGRSGKNSK